MGIRSASLTRKDFLKLAGLTSLAGSLPRQLFLSMQSIDAWPALSLDQLPRQMRAVLSQVPDLAVDQQGRITLQRIHNSEPAQLPLAQTQWNIDHSNRWDRLVLDSPWGIVLHWFGDEMDFDRTVSGYLRGFNFPRRVADYTTITSAHFLVGENFPVTSAGWKDEPVAILQTQAADADGTPFTASHLQPLDFQAHHEKRQYFVRALYELGYREPTIHSILQDWFDGPSIDANVRTISVEITGSNFEAPGHMPTSQQIANTTGVVWALMRRYLIPASSLLGHHEVQLEKPDPGKRFLAQVRCLLGAKALVENDPEMSRLIFGQHLGKNNDPLQATRIYIKWVRDYLVMVSRPGQVYTWEAESGYWFLYDRIFGTSMPIAKRFTLPVAETAILTQSIFAAPGSDDGVDFYIDRRALIQPLPARLMSNGKCLYAGDSHGWHDGKQAMFLHRQPDGAEIVSIYCNLGSLADLHAGEVYGTGYPVGEIERSQNGDGLLHFAIAYRSTWENCLSTDPDAPYHADTAWVREHYLDPIQFLKDRTSLLNSKAGEKINSQPE